MRNKRLDILRCIAVLLVIFTHGGGAIWPGLAHRGWVGVDLFFVLSGFLISGLLFSEYKTRGSISFKRFFVRRGLKIYPAFYLYLFLTCLISAIVFKTVGPVAHVLSEVFFVQNYCHGVWDHTWSLAVEEHFYILLPVLLLFMVKISGPGQGNPFYAIPRIFVVVAVLCPAFRAVSVCFGTPNYRTAITASHARMDALFFGVLLGYLYHFCPQVLDQLLQPAWNRVVIAACTMGLLSTVCLFPRESVFFSIFGFTCVYLGFGGILLLSLYVHEILRGKIAQFARAIGTAAASVGMYSYSIYLWHGPAGAWFPGLVRQVLHVSSFGANGRFAVYLIGSLVIGITMSKVVEYPVLQLRDRIFPAREGMVVRLSETGQQEASMASKINATVSPV